MAGQMSLSLREQKIKISLEGRSRADGKRLNLPLCWFIIKDERRGPAPDWTLLDRRDFMEYEGQICRTPMERGAFMLPV